MLILRGRPKDSSLLGRLVIEQTPKKSAHASLLLWDGTYLKSRMCGSGSWTS